MANAIFTTQSAPGLFTLGISAIMENYPRYPAEWKKIYTIRKSYKRKETYLEMAPIAGAGRIGEGGNFPLASARQLGTLDVYNQKYGIMTGFTIEAIDDDLYPGTLGQTARGLENSLLELKELQGIAWFDNAFYPVSPEYYMADKQPLCSTQHRNALGTYSNMIAPAQLSSTTYSELKRLVKRTTNPMGERSHFLIRALLVGVANEDAAAIMFGSQYDPNSANNAINPNAGGKYIVSHYMANDTNWFILTNYQDGAIHQLKQELRCRSYVVEENENVMINASERYAFAITNPRVVFGANAFN